MDLAARRLYNFLRFGSDHRLQALPSIAESACHVARAAADKTATLWDLSQNIEKGAHNDKAKTVHKQDLLCT